MAYSYAPDTITKQNAWTGAFDFIAVHRIPEFGILGLNAEGKFSLQDWPNTKVVFKRDSDLPMESHAVGNGAGSATALTVTTGQGQYFQADDIIAIVDPTNEAVRRQAIVVSVSGDTLTIAAHGSADAWTNGDTVKILSNARPEASSPITDYQTVPTEGYNYTQIIDGMAMATKTELATNRQIISDMLDHRMRKLVVDGSYGPGKLAKRLLSVFYYGIASERTASVNGTAGGFDHFVSTNVTNANGAQLDTTMLHDVGRSLASYGNKNPVLLCNTWQYEVLNGLYDGARVDTMDSPTGGAAPVTTIRTPASTFTILQSEWCPKGSIYFLNPAYAGWFPLRPFETEDITTNQDLKGRKILGEWTFGLTHEGMFGKIHNLKVGA
jgi:hypothetical protein